MFFVMQYVGRYGGRAEQVIRFVFSVSLFSSPVRFIAYTGGVFTNCFFLFILF